MLAHIINWLIVSLGGLTRDQADEEAMEHGCKIRDLHREEAQMLVAEAYRNGEAHGRKLAVTKFAVLPLPFTEDQLRGAQHGEFITPGGNFAVVFGECNIPAPSQHGYEQIARYVNKHDLSPLLGDIVCHHGEKFGAYPWDSENLVPVIITVLR